MRRIAVILLVLPILLTGCAATSAPSTSAAPVPSNSVLGYRPWSSATLPNAASRDLTVQADVDSINDELSCVPTATAVVKETAATIVIHTQVINHDLPPGVACAGVGRSSIAATVRLGRPIGTRKLIDEADRRSHPPLILSESPMPHPVPARFGSQHTRWIESRDEIYSWWRRSHDTAQINLDIRDSAAGFQQAPLDAVHVLVSGGKGLAWTEQDPPDTVQHHVTWTTPAGRAFDLDVIDQSRRPFTAAQVLDIARSIH